MVALFSGRFDPPHIGHVITINSILCKYDHVLVVTLDYPSRFVTAWCANTVLAQALGNTALLYVTLIINRVHFGKITERGLRDLLLEFYTSVDNCVYCGGNEDVNKHIESLGIMQVEYFPRSYEYSSTEIRESRCKSK